MLSSLNRIQVLVSCIALALAAPSYQPGRRASRSQAALADDALTEILNRGAQILGQLFARNTVVVRRSHGYVQAMTKAALILLRYAASCAL